MQLFFTSVNCFFTQEPRCLSCCSTSPSHHLWLIFTFKTIFNFTFKINMIKKRGKATLPGKAMVTYRYWMRLGDVLAMQNPLSGHAKEKLESLYLSQGAGKPEITGVAPLPGINVEELSDREIKDLVTNWANGHKIQYILDRETGKAEPHVMMHSLTPHLMSGKAVEVKDFKERENPSSGQRTEVNIIK